VNPAAPSVPPAQDALAAEHAAVYAYGVAGGVVDPLSDDGARVRDAYAVHERRRDQLESLLRGLGAEPVAAEPGYALPAPVTGAASATRLAVGIEDRCAVAYAAVVASSTGDVRRAAVDWLADAATRGLGLGAAPTAFPGLARPGQPAR